MTDHFTIFERQIPPCDFPEVRKCSHMQRQSTAHLQRVIVKHSHGHLFLSSDIIMEIPTHTKDNYNEPT